MCVYNYRAGYLVGVYRVRMLISIYHRQGDRHSIANKRYGYCVASNVRKCVQGRHLRAWETMGREGDTRG